MARKPTKRRKPVHEPKPRTDGLTIVRVPIDSLKADPDNPRTHDETNLGAIKGSLDAFGQVEPLVIQKGTRRIVAGHGRLEAMKRRGDTHADIVEIDVSDEQATALGIALNRSGELASWDMPKLASLIENLPEDLQPATGFSTDDLKEILDDINPPAVIEDEAPEPAPKAVTKPGDLWLMGKHRLLCGDSTKSEDVDKVMDGKKAALVSTDPPYLVDYTGERPEASGKDWSATYKEQEVKDHADFFTKAFRQILRVLAPHAPIYSWHAHKQYRLLSEVWEKLGILNHQQVVWVKPTSVFGRVFWHFRHEPCMMGWRKGSQPEHNGAHSANSVWTDHATGKTYEDMSKSELIKALKDASSVWEIDWEGKSRIIGNEHPTQKPVEIFARPMRKHTQRGAICFEPFSGSGSQLSAAEQTGRICYSIELEPVFVDVAIRRWQGLTGQEAVHSETGKTWRATAKARKVSVPDAT